MPIAVSTIDGAPVRKGGVAGNLLAVGFSVLAALIRSAFFMPSERKPAGSQ